MSAGVLAAIQKRKEGIARWNMQGCIRCLTCVFSVKIGGKQGISRVLIGVN